MSKSPRNPLPLGVKGVDLGEGVLIFANDKLVVTAKGTGEHVTLHLGPKSKVLDIHRTSTADGTTSRTRLFSITHANLAAMIREIAAPMSHALAGLVHPLDTRKMARQRIGAIVGLLPTGPRLTAVSKVHSRRVVVDSRRIAAEAWAPEFLDDLYALEDGEIFTLFSCQARRRPPRIGHGFVVRDRRGQRRLMWIPDRQLAEAIERLGALLRDAAAKYGMFFEQ